MNRTPGPCLDLKAISVLEKKIIVANGSLDRISRQILTDEGFAERLAKVLIAESEGRQAERRNYLTEIGRENLAIQTTRE
jgi:hypothetical protein